LTMTQDCIKISTILYTKCNRIHERGIEMEAIKRKAYAKINLSLDVTGVRPNGYHEVDMIMQTIDLYDELSFQKTEGEIRLTCVNQTSLSMGTDNLIYKAVIAMQNAFDFQGGVSIELTKNIPMAAGMAGGSTDCAATLLAINELYELGATKEELCKIGVTLGADVPYCIMGGTARATGIGEILESISCQVDPYLVLVKPAEGASTKDIYRALDTIESKRHPNVDGMIEALAEGNLLHMCEELGNILEPVTCQFVPKVTAICDALVEWGAVGARMSGSGPTVFAVFTSKEQAWDALQRAKETFPECFCCETRFVK